IQSLYSKKDNPETGGDGESYLEFCYKKECELTIFRKLVPMFLEKFNSDPNSQFKYRFNYPSTNPNFHKGSPKTGLLCRDDEDYFLINNIRFVLNSYNSSVHDEFWQEIRN
ncbi:MAG TPA: hypothetical protein PLC65_06305, partial [Bacteroidia bacterium]|nr:hypothetical protein [Bacteroidia bacterium]